MLPQMGKVLSYSMPDRVYLDWNATAPLRPEARQAMARTLQSANRVWIVGEARPSPAGFPLSIQPAPHPDFGWNERIYVAVWWMQLAQFLQQHTIYRDLALQPMPQVNPYEDVAVMVCEGWQD